MEIHHSYLLYKQKATALAAATWQSGDLLIFDTDASDIGLESDEWQLLLLTLPKEPTKKVRLVVKKKDWLEARAPKFAKLAQLLSHKVEIRVAGEQASRLQGSFVCCPQGLLRKAVEASPQFAAFDHSDLHELNEMTTLFEEIWQEAGETASFRPLGL